MCLLTATIFWFLNALNKTYTTNLNFPLLFEYDHSSFVPVKSLPQAVRMNVTGNGWDLFKRSTGVKVSPLEIPLERPSETKKIVGSTLPKFFSSQADGLEINFVLTDTIYLDLDAKSGRWVKLVMDSLAKNFKKGYGLVSHVTLLPDSVFLEGPQRLIKQFSNPVALTLRQRNIDEDFSEDVEIVIPSSEVIKRDPPTVSVTFEVEKMVTVQDSLLITAINVPSTISFVEKRFLPVVLSIPESKMKNLNLDSARAVLNLKNFTRGAAVILPKIEGLPPFTQITKIDSVRIRL